MTLIVVDASTVAAWVLPSQSSRSANALLQEVRQHRLIAPHIFPIEVRSLLLSAERRGRWNRDRTESALNQLEALDIQIMHMDAPNELSQVVETARMSGLTIYDAFYLRLAETDGATLASRDKAMLSASARNAVPILDLNL